MNAYLWERSFGAVGSGSYLIVGVGGGEVEKLYRRHTVLLRSLAKGGEELEFGEACCN